MIQTSSLFGIDSDIAQSILLSHLGYTYYAFISYSHKDEKWAKWLQNALERYRLPSAAFDSIGPIPWTNFYYPEDYIALYSPLPSDRFPSAHNIRLALPPSVSPLDAHRAYWSGPTLAHHIRTLAMVNTGLAPVP